MQAATAFGLKTFPMETKLITAMINNSASAPSGSFSKEEQAEALTMLKLRLTEAFVVLNRRTASYEAQLAVDTPPVGLNLTHYEPEKARRDGQRERKKFLGLPAGTDLGETSKTGLQ